MRAIEPAPGSSFSFEEGESFGVRLAGEKGEEEAGVAPLSKHGMVDLSPHLQEFML